MNALVPQNFGTLSTRFQSIPIENDLGAGVSGGFPVVGYKGKVWSIRYRGEEKQLMREDGDGPRGSVEVVILKSSTVVSKVWYEKGYEEGTSKGVAPDCFSTNGITPDPAAAKKQASVCKLCPKDAFGTAKRADGTPGKGKACSDSKRMAVALLGSINHDMGPMLLRVPAGSMNDLSFYGDGLKKMGYHYYSVGTRIGFDPADAYPKFVFNPIRALTDAEAEAVLALRDDVRVDRILAESDVVTDEKPALTFEQPPANPTPPPAQTAVSQSTPAVQQSVQTPAQPAPAASPSKPAPAARKPKPVAAPATQQAAVAEAQAEALKVPTQPVSAEAFDDALDAEMEALMGK
jgi:hypothetical protein